MNDGSSEKKHAAPLDEPKAELEMMYIDEYLHEQGHSRAELAALLEEEAARLMTEASRYASLKLAELEARARLRARIHDGVE